MCSRRLVCDGAACTPSCSACARDALAGRHHRRHRARAAPPRLPPAASPPQEAPTRGLHPLLQRAQSIGLLTTEKLCVLAPRQKRARLVCTARSGQPAAQRSETWARRRKHQGSRFAAGPGKAMLALIFQVAAAPISCKDIYCTCSAWCTTALCDKLACTGCDICRIARTAGPAANAASAYGAAIDPHLNSANPVALRRIYEQPGGCPLRVGLSKLEDPVMIASYWLSGSAWWAFSLSAVGACG